MVKGSFSLVEVRVLVLFCVTYVFVLMPLLRRVLMLFGDHPQPDSIVGRDWVLGAVLDHAVPCVPVASGSYGVCSSGFGRMPVPLFLLPDF